MWSENTTNLGGAVAREMPLRFRYHDVTMTDGIKPLASPKVLSFGKAKKRRVGAVKPSHIGEGLVRVDVSFASFLCAKEKEGKVVVV